MMQSMPAHLNIDDVRNELNSIPGVLSIHELHVWQLSNTKTVASIHVLLGKDAPNTYMGIASKIKRCLHRHGIHSTTIQPEFADQIEGPIDEKVCVFLIIRVVY